MHCSKKTESHVMRWKKLSMEKETALKHLHQVWDFPGWTPAVSGIGVKRPNDQNGMVTHSGEGRVYERSATSLHLHKCVARWVLARVCQRQLSFICNGGAPQSRAWQIFKPPYLVCFFTLCYIVLQYDNNNNFFFHSAPYPITFWTTLDVQCGVSCMTGEKSRSCFEHVSVSLQRFNSVFTWLLILPTN